MRNINFEPTYAKIILPQKQDLVWKYETPTDVFELSSLELKAGSSVKWTSSQEEILMIVKGSLEVSCGNSSLALKQGHPAMLISGGEEIRVDVKEDGWVFRARGLKV